MIRCAKKWREPKRGGTLRCPPNVAAVHMRCGRNLVGGRNIQPEGARAVCTQLVRRFNFRIIHKIIYPRIFKQKTLLHRRTTRLESLAEDSETHGISATRRHWTQGLGTMPRMHDLRA